jgi:hypothetical protein
MKDECETGWTLSRSMGKMGNYKSSIPAVYLSWLPALLARSPSGMVHSVIPGPTRGAVHQVIDRVSNG